MNIKYAIVLTTKGNFFLSYMRPDAENLKCFRDLFFQATKTWWMNLRNNFSFTPSFLKCVKSLFWLLIFRGKVHDSDLAYFLVGCKKNSDIKDQKNYRNRFFQKISKLTWKKSVWLSMAWNSITNVTFLPSRSSLLGIRRKKVKFRLEEKSFSSQWYISHQKGQEPKN